MSDVSPSATPSSSATPTPSPSGGAADAGISLGDFQQVTAFAAAAGSADSLAQWLGINPAVFSEEGSATGEGGASTTPSPTA